jgi:colanic acid/amylovoran biosynthesis glycosyltransferase
MKHDKHLIFFTASFPFGLGETWKSNELKVLVKKFKRITVVPLSYAGNFVAPKPLPDGVSMIGPLFEQDQVAVGPSVVVGLVSRRLPYYLEEFLSRGAWRSRARFKKWISASLAIERLWAHPALRELLEMSDGGTILYFYWGRGSCDIVPLLKGRQVGKTVVRMHRYDLFETENDGYIPYRRQLMASANLIAPTSEAGARHLRNLYPREASKVQVLRCGTVGEGRSKPSMDGVLRVCSCSYLVPVKRVHILVEALGLLGFPVHWTHLGDGPLMSEILAKAATLPPNVTVQLPGMVDSRLILRWLLDHPVDVFVNVSASEGVPFSIMEAFSAGIPVFATAVGGSGEIVDEKVGKALPPDVTPQDLASEIERLRHLSHEERSQMREAAFRRYEEMCNAERLASELGALLDS